jgi:hypothetical protein
MRADCTAMQASEWEDLPADQHHRGTERVPVQQERDSPRAHRIGHLNPQTQEMSIL